MNSLIEDKDKEIKKLKDQLSAKAAAESELRSVQLLMLDYERRNNSLVKKVQSLESSAEKEGESQRLIGELRQKISDLKLAEEAVNIENYNLNIFLKEAVQVQEKYQGFSLVVKSQEELMKKQKEEIERLVSELDDVKSKEEAIAQEREKDLWNLREVLDKIRKEKRELAQKLEAKQNEFALKMEAHQETLKLHSKEKENLINEVEKLKVREQVKDQNKDEEVGRLQENLNILVKEKEELLKAVSHFKNFNKRNRKAVKNNNRL